MGIYGAADDTESIATIHAALDAGITLLDTGDYYAAGHNELLIGRALRRARSRRRRDQREVRPDARTGRRRRGRRRRPAAVKNSLAYSLRRLGTDHVDIYRLGRLDPSMRRFVEMVFEAAGASPGCGQPHDGVSRSPASSTPRSGP
jgi:aryl-alcohol dehydrogenase-like predicted oxidoreductase